MSHRSTKPKLIESINPENTSVSLTNGGTAEQFGKESGNEPMMGVEKATVQQSASEIHSSQGRNGTDPFSSDLERGQGG
jgi:hypothetical protein